MSQSKFGKKPSGARLEKMKASPHYKDGQFHNLSYTPTLAEGHSYVDVMYQMFIKSKPRNKPSAPLPSVKTDLLNLPADANVLVWFGHSSYFLQVDGIRILVDPVFSGNASPIPGSVKAFKGTDVYGVSDLPKIDYLLITHDHYDHLDYPTIAVLKPKVANVICGLGVGAHFEYWGYPAINIIEKDWYEEVDLPAGLKLFVQPSRHFSGRSFNRNNTLWASYVLQTPSMTIYLGGDSGYDSHYAAIGEKFGPIDIAILDCGQYNQAWKNIHNLPEDVIQAVKDLKAKRLLPVHSSKFALALHPWDEPLTKITELSAANGMPLITPMIGEAVHLADTTQQFKQWWVGL